MRRGAEWSRPPIFKCSCSMSSAHNRLDHFNSSFTMESYRGWRRRVAIAFYVISFIAFVRELQHLSVNHFIFFRVCFLMHAVGERWASGVWRVWSDVGHYAPQWSVHDQPVSRATGRLCSREAGHCTGMFSESIDIRDIHTRMSLISMVNHTSKCY